MKTFLRVFFLAFSLVWLTTNPALAQVKVLVCGAPADDTWGNEVQSKLIGTGQFSQVDYFDCTNSAPTLTQLEGYNAVLAFTDAHPASGTGDVLAQYVDGGGGLVIAMFGNTSTYEFTGNIATSTYECLVPGNFAVGTELTLGAVLLPGHPIMNGVTSFDGGTSSYEEIAPTLATGAYEIADWSNGDILISARENVSTNNVRRADLNFYPPSSDSRSDFWISTTNGALIMANALTWVSGVGGCTSPSVTTNPLNDSDCRGYTASFTAAASGSPTPTVQWMVSTNGGATWSAISGANSTTYTTGVVTSSMNGYEYEAVFTNICEGDTASVTTNPAILVVGTPPVMTSNPSPTTESVCAGTTASWSATASGIITPTPQWQVSTDQGNTWNDIPGANSTTLSFTTTASESGYKYRCVFTNYCGQVTSRSASLVVPSAPGTPTCPSSVTVRAGSNALFNSTASGFPTPTVQWQVSTNGGGSWSNISGATANTLTLHSVTSGMNGYEYHAVFTNGCGSSTSCAATLTVD